MNRRNFLNGTLGTLAVAAASPATLVLAQCRNRTETNIEGPFYKPGAPQRGRLTDEYALVLSGRVMDTGCRPLQGAVVDVWHADADGEYDLRGYRFRGQLRTGSSGRYSVQTIRPGHYLNGPSYRPAHIHFKIHANGRERLTTQVYFPNDPYNDADPWFRRALVASYHPSVRGEIPSIPEPTRMRFDFVV